MPPRAKKVAPPTEGPSTADSVQDADPGPSVPQTLVTPNTPQPSQDQAPEPQSTEPLSGATPDMQTMFQLIMGLQSTVQSLVAAQAPPVLPTPPQEEPPAKRPRFQVRVQPEEEEMSTGSIRPEPGCARRVDGMETAVTRTTVGVARVLERLGTSPLTSEILTTPMPEGARISSLPTYQGGDPEEHVSNFDHHMILVDMTDGVWCKAFPTTLRGNAQQWYRNLPPNSISSFKQLAGSFISRFSSGRRPALDTSILFRVVQGRDESLRSYTERFNETTLKLPRLEDNVAIIAFNQGVRSQALTQSLAIQPVDSMAELMERAGGYIRAEEVISARREEAREEEPRLKPDPPRPRNLGGAGSSRQMEESRRKMLARPLPPRLGGFTPLTVPREKLILELQTRFEVPPPAKMKSHPDRRSRNRYCRFHDDYGHTTEECKALAQAIEELIQKGHLQRYVRQQEGQQPRGRVGCREKPEERERSRSPPPRPSQKGKQIVVHTIAGGLAAGGESTQGRKGYVRAGREQTPSHQPPARKEVISFSEDDLEGVITPHEDALTIEVRVNNGIVKRMMVDTGSSVEVLYMEAFNKLELTKDMLRPMRSRLTGFMGSSYRAEGVISLPLTLEDGAKRATMQASFVVMDCRSAFNGIIGRMALHKLRAIPSTYHQVLKFPSSRGIGAIRGDQLAARSCYEVSLRPKYTTDWEPDLPEKERDLKRGVPVEELEEVQLSEPHKRAKIGSELPDDLKKGISHFLFKNEDVFAWTSSDMTGVDPKIMVHRLNTDPEFRPHKQRLRTISDSAKREGVTDEVEKLLEAGHIREIQYPTWLSNVVMVRKDNGKWRLCVDFSDLNKACPKDCFPLPRIDQLVDATSGFELLSFMDAFKGYNQIQMAPEDQEKTAFITEQGLFCYEVMPFGLKNAGATYQRMVSKVFKSQIGRNMEVYVDDMLVKSRRAEDHVTDLAEAFETMKRVGIRLNPDKCAFGVKAGKFLGFMVTSRGIEINPDKIDAILELAPPTTMKQVQVFAGKIAALSRFMSKSADKCAPLFKILRTPRSFVWSDECQRAFEELREYLMSPPVLSRPEEGETLILYLSCTGTAVAGVLLREDGKEQRPVYYVSRTLRGAEVRYSPIEKVAFALVTTSRRLKPYFDAHTIRVMTDAALKCIMSRPEASGRLLKWAVELSQFDLEYQPRAAIKGQAVADFVVECTGRPLEGSELWVMKVDGASGKSGSGAGVYIVDPGHFEHHYSFRFTFPASNNEAEYEALVAGLRIAAELGAKNLDVFTDSQLVANQVSGEYEAKEATMVAYLGKVKQLSSEFHRFTLTQIPRSENEVADALSKLAVGEPGPITVQVEELEQPSVQTEEKVAEIQAREDWTTPIREYLEGGTLPDDEVQSRKIEKQAPRFVILRDQLYKKSFTWPLLKCVGPEDGDYILREVHEGICGNHIGGKALARKILRAGYFWPTLDQDAKTYVRKCDTCQRFANIQRQPATELTSIVSPWPFYQWGLDLVGPLPPGQGQRRYAYVAVDYFTKWVEGEAVARITEKTAWSFIWRFIICRFGVPGIIVTDHGTQFDNAHFKKQCSELGISLRFASVAHPQCNGQVEVSNRSVLQGIRKKLGAAKGLWPDILPEVLWAQRTTPHAINGESPYELTFGVEAVLPVEIGSPTTRTQFLQEEHNGRRIREELDLAEELRTKAQVRMIAGKKALEKAFAKKVRRKPIKVGDFVLRKSIFGTRAEGKLGPNWDGPYLVVKELRPGTYILADSTNKELKHAWHAEHLRPYFA